jgi:hypothetical protein
VGLLGAARELHQYVLVAVRSIVQPQQRAPAPLELERRSRQHVRRIEYNHFVKVRLLARGARVIVFLLSHCHVMAVVTAGAAAPVRLIVARAPF